MSELIEPSAEFSWGWGGDTALWVGVLGGPIAAMLHLQIAYVLVPVYCHSGSALWLHVTSIGCLLLAVVAGITAWSCLQRARPNGDPVEEELPLRRPYFLAWIGVWTSALFALFIIAQAIATFMIDPCWL